MLQYDWQEEPEGTFLKWFLPEVLTHTPEMPGQEEVTMHDFSVLTRRFTDVQVKITINGVEVPADGFFEAIERNIEWAAKKEAVAMYEAAGLGRLYPVLNNLEDKVRELVVTEFSAAGIELFERDY